MSQPIINDTYAFILNEANQFTHTELLRPAIQNCTHCRVISSYPHVALNLNFVRASYLLDADSTTGASSLPGLCVPSDKTWWELNTNYIDKVEASVYDFYSGQPDSISLAVQFVNFDTA